MAATQFDAVAYLNDLYEQAQRGLQELAQGEKASVATHMGELDRTPAPPVRRYKTGLPDLDAKLGGGLSTRQLTIVMAPPADGKSALAVATSIHVQAEVPVLYASTELETNELEARLAAQLLNCPWRDIVDGTIERKLLDGALERLRTMRIYAIGCERLPMGDAALATIDSECRRLATPHGVPPLVVVDYLQDLARGADERAVRGKIGALATRCRAMAQRLDCVMLVISSVSRAYYGIKRAQEMREADDPSVYLAAAKESGDVDYAAAVVMFLDVAAAEPGAGYRCARIAVAKSRHGETGFVGARFHGASGQWQAAPDEVKESAGRREAAAKASEKDHLDLQMLAAVTQAAQTGDWRTTSSWRDLPPKDMKQREVIAALARLTEPNGPLTLNRMHPGTKHMLPRGQYVVRREDAR